MSNHKENCEWSDGFYHHSLQTYSSGSECETIITDEYIIIDDEYADGECKRIEFNFCPICGCSLKNN